MDERASQQLSALGSVDERFARAGVAYWVFGGWAVDLYAAAVTRPHDDIDLAVWSKDAGQIHELLEADGWRHVPSEEDDGGTGYEREAVRLELTFLDRDPGGGVFTPLRQGRIAWPDRSFCDDVRELNGVRARLVTLATLLAWKSHPRDDPADAAKDRADHDVLS